MDYKALQEHIHELAAYEDLIEHKYRLSDSDEAKLTLGLIYSVISVVGALGEHLSRNNAAMSQKELVGCIESVIATTALCALELELNYEQLHYTGMQLADSSCLADMQLAVMCAAGMLGDECVYPQPEKEVARQGGTMISNALGCLYKTVELEVVEAVMTEFMAKTDDDFGGEPLDVHSL